MINKFLHNINIKVKPQNERYLSATERCTLHTIQVHCIHIYHYVNYTIKISIALIYL